MRKTIFLTLLISACNQAYIKKYDRIDNSVFIQVAGKTLKGTFYDMQSIVDSLHTNFIGLPYEDVLKLNGALSNAELKYHNQQKWGAGALCLRMINRDTSYVFLYPNVVIDLNGKINYWFNDKDTSYTNLLYDELNSLTRN